MSNTQQVIIILGMHRSGTSCLAGSIEKAGIYFGNVSQRNAFNLKGNRENQQIINLNNDVLAYNNGAWDNPPPRVEWPLNLKKERDKIIEQNNQTSTWGVKDPRILLTLDGWLEVLPNVTFAATYRHPSHVAQSLSHRDNFPLEKSLSLWKIYNEKLLCYFERYHFSIVSFDQTPHDYAHKIKKLLCQLNIDSENSRDEFYDYELRHHFDAPLYEIPMDIMKIFDKLNQAAI